MEEDLSYVGIENPVIIRKNVLESSKLVLQNLQIMEDIKDVRGRKAKSEKRLNDQISELRDEIRKLRRVLPNIKPASGASKRKPRAIEDLEKELEAVERELDNVKR